MINPILQSRRSILIYFSAWTLIAALHAIVFFVSFPVGLFTAISDAAAASLLMAIFGVGLWYAARYNEIKEQDLLQSFIYHLVISILVIAIWYSLTTFVVTTINDNNPYYLELIDRSSIWRVIAGFCYYLIMMLVFYAINFYHSLKEKEIQQAQLQSYLREAELRSLKSQLNPHFIFNGLNSINALTITAPEKAREMVVKLSEFLRYSLKKDGHKELTTLKEELENIQRYLDIEKVRFENRLQYEVRAPEDCLDKTIPIYVLQPLVENAIKHGVYGSIDQVTIQLDCRMRGDNLTLRIANNYDKNESLSKKGSGVGLKNIRNRLNIIYGDEHLLKISDDGRLFSVTLTIPVKEKELQ